MLSDNGTHWLPSREWKYEICFDQRGSALSGPEFDPRTIGLPRFISSVPQFGINPGKFYNGLFNHHTPVLYNQCSVTYKVGAKIVYF